MFTGIVATRGVIADLAEQGGGRRIRIDEIDVSGLATGDSVAVDGVCLTAVQLQPGGFVADLLPETLHRSTLNDVRVGQRVNIELAATPQTLLGGHLLQGHVDGVATIAARAPGQAWDDVTFRLPAGLTQYVVEKGSIALDGVSLTVVSVAGDDVAVSLIPETLRRTTLGAKAVGDRVNVEVDVLAKYVARQVANLLAAQQGQR